jgi:parvulin-like peptidyl-prolyl isomerase
MARLLRAPLAHFLALGGALLALRTWLDPPRAPRPRVVITAADVARLAEAWTEAHGTSPDAKAREGLVNQAIDEELLYREALARGFDRQDGAVRERLVRLGGFVGEESARDREALERDARRLGLERSDLVIRRHLVEMMELAAGWVSEADLPSEPELREYLARHAEHFAQPARVRLTHVYLSEDARRDATTADALALLEELRGSGAEAGAGRGDAFIRGAAFDGSRDELARAFGTRFAEAVDRAPSGEWFGPVRSGYGLHLVWVYQREPGRTPSLAEVQGRVLQRWLRERADERRGAAVRALRAAYDVEVEDGSGNASQRTPAN